MKMWGIMFIALLSIAAAEGVRVSGFVTWESGAHIPGASVSATCHDETRNGMTDLDGNYDIDFTGTECVLGDRAYVTATYGDARGSASGIVENWTGILVAIVDVTVPEFTAIAALAALGGGAAVLYLRRRK